MSQRPHQGARGFTLIEVLIALLVVALGIGALLTTISASADTIARLRDKSFAQWIALNQISTLRLSGAQPSVGVTYGTTDFAGGSWRWQQEITDPGVAGILRVEVRVAQLVKGKGTEAPSQPLGDTPMASVGSAFGFLGSSSARPSGQNPDWSFDSIQTAGGGAGGGAARGAGGGATPGGPGGAAGGGGISGGGGMAPIQVP